MVFWVNPEMKYFILESARDFSFLSKKSGITDINPGNNIIISDFSA